MSENNPSQPHVIDEDIWGTHSPSSENDASSSESAFSDPSIVLDAQEDVEGEQQHEEMPQDKPPQSKPNMAILGVAALIGVAVLGGVGYMGYQTFGNSRSMAAPSPVGMQMEVAATAGSGPSTGSGVFDAPAGAAASSPQSVFATGSTAGVEVGATVDPAHPVPGAAQHSSVAPDSAADAVTKVRALDASVDLAAGVAAQVAATAPVVAPVTEVDAVKAPARVMTPKATAPKTPDAVVRVASVKKKPARNTTVAKAGKARKKNAVSTDMAKNASEQPVDDVRVVGIYPLSGKNAQAWLRSKQGATKVVSQGDVINGIRILAVVPEKGLVKTSFGDLTSRGWTP